jgi:hypothetical protein
LQHDKGVPISLLKKFRFEAKLSETGTVSLGVASVSQNHRKIFLLRFALFRLKSISLPKFHFKKFRFKSFALETVSLRVWFSIGFVSQSFASSLFCFAWFRF